MKEISPERKSFFLRNFKTYLKSFVRMNSIGTKWFINNIDIFINLMPEDMELLLSYLVIGNFEFEEVFNKHLQKALLSLNRKNAIFFEDFLNKWCDVYADDLMKNITGDFLENLIDRISTQYSLFDPFLSLENKHFITFILKFKDYQIYETTALKMAMVENISNLCYLILEIHTYILRRDIDLKFINQFGPYSRVLLSIFIRKNDILSKKQLFDILILLSKEKNLANSIIYLLNNKLFFTQNEMKNIPNIIELNEEEIINGDLYNAEQFDRVKLIFLKNVLINNIAMRESIIDALLPYQNIFIYLLLFSKIPTVEQSVFYVIKCFINFEKLDMIYEELLKKLFIPFGHHHLILKFKKYPTIPSRYNYIILVYKLFRERGYNIANNIYSFYNKEILKNSVFLNNKELIVELLEDIWSDELIRYVFEMFFYDIPEATMLDYINKE